MYLIYMPLQMKIIINNFFLNKIFVRFFRFHQQALVEVKILEQVTKKDRDGFFNVIHMLDHFYFRNHLCITFELMG